ncbi:MAG TPA: GreA/GreB family elongation factor [Gammaproteobacteria bacterium]|nr:GreA/GreB family elongation factor [Gammaproteobacteria bacterium]
MSRAFVKESDDAGEPLPELAVSPHPNFVTPEGLRLVEARIETLGAELKAARAADDRPLLARVNRDLRYWTQRRATARVVEPTAEPAVARFGVTVTLSFADDGSEARFKIVGEDEADPASGLVSFVSPLAKALLGKKVGDEVRASDRDAEIVALA